MAKKNTKTVKLRPNEMVVDVSDNNKYCAVSLTGGSSASGCEATFYRRGNSKYGIKAYSSLPLAISSYNRQQKASQHGLGPEVGRFLIVKVNGLTYFGYETQKAKSISSNRQLYNAKYLEVRHKLQKLGIGGDFGDRNCGIIGDRIVAVDFGSHSETATW